MDVSWVETLVDQFLRLGEAPWWLVFMGAGVLCFYLWNRRRRRIRDARSSEEES